MKRQVILTNGQRGILRKLVLDEARRLGYGKEYRDFNTPTWPRRLKQLRVIASQLNPYAPPWGELPGVEVRAPASRVEALQDLENAFALALHAMGCDEDETLREAAIRQIRCDLHTLSVSTDELDEAGLR